MFKKYFNNFLHYAVIIALLFPFRFGISHLLYLANSSKSKAFIVVITLMFLFSIYYYNRGHKKLKVNFDSINDKKLLPTIIISAFILRLLWIIAVPTQPVSDFELIYQTAGQASAGNFTSFQGIAYFARFTHNVVTVLYFSIFYKFTANPLFLIKFSNVIFQTASIYALYLVAKQLFNKEKALLCAIIMAFFPPFIMYTSEIMSENLAMPIYLFSIYLFLRGIDTDKNKFFIISGVLLSAANMFRMVGIIFIIAYIVYNFIYKGIKLGLKNNVITLASYLIPLYLVSQSLISAGVTDTHLWKPKESNFTSILRGSSIQYNGRWNVEDASLPEKYNYDMDKVNAAAKEIVIKRYTTTPFLKLTSHFINKLSMQWGIGDFGASGWTIQNADNTSVGSALKYRYYEIYFVTQLIYLIMLIRIFIVMLKKDYVQIEKINFFYILFGGFILLYLISENQERYSFIVSWIFIILQLGFTPKLNNAK